MIDKKHNLTTNVLTEPQFGFALLFSQNPNKNAKPHNSESLNIMPCIYVLARK